jgi:hypothetical protein
VNKLADTQDGDSALLDRSMIPCSGLKSGVQIDKTGDSTKPLKV